MLPRGEVALIVDRHRFQQRSNRQRDIRRRDHHDDNHDGSGPDPVAVVFPVEKHESTGHFISIVRRWVVTRGLVWARSDVRGGSALRSDAKT